jgi:hypothetical protein
MLNPQTNPLHITATLQYKLCSCSTEDIGIAPQNYKDSLASLLNQNPCQPKVFIQSGNISVAIQFLVIL